MRTTAAENAQMGKWIGDKLNQFLAPAYFLIPLKGFSALDHEGQLFHDPEADQAFIRSLEATITNPDITIVKLPYHINDKEFSAAVAEHYNELRKE